GVDADAGAERETPAVDAADGDAPRAARLDRLGEPPCGGDRIGRQAERARENARAAAWQEADRHVALEPIERLVEAAVAGVHDDRLAVVVERGGDELGRMIRVLGEHDHQVARRLERGLHLGELRLRHMRGERIDDQRDPGQTVSESRARQGVAYPRIPSTSSAVKRSASGSVSDPGRSHVYAQFTAESARSAAVPSSRSVRSAPSSRPSRKSARKRSSYRRRSATNASRRSPSRYRHSRTKTVATSSCSATTRRCARSASRIRSTTGPSSGTVSSPAWKAAAPSLATSQRRSAFDSMWE